MDFKKKLRAFFTLTRKSDGFTLVELVVVIAVLGILGGVAVPAYGGYVTKANKQADISLASEVEQALLLAHYSGEVNDGAAVIICYDEQTGGVYVLTEDEAATAAGTADTAAAAMEKTFGGGYAETLRLKYDSWIEEGADGSNALNNVSAESITDAVGSLTGLASAASAANSDETIYNVLSEFCQLSDDQKEELASYQGQENYSTIATNLMVKYLADDIGNKQVTWSDDGFVYNDGSAVSTGTEYAMYYAVLYSMSNSGNSQATTQLENLNNELKAIADAEEQNSKDTDVTDALETAFDNLFGPVDDGNGGTVLFYDTFIDYLDNNSGDISDITSAMGAMSKVAEDYNDLEALSDASLFSGSNMKNAIAAYQLAVEYGGVAIQITDGVCTVMPKLS